MAESSLYRQRLEVIAEKRRLQEEIRAARLELEEEKLRVERLKRKSLRERWLMDGAAEGSDWPKDPASQDSQSPEGQAQVRIRNLEDSLFTLQSQLQLLQSASTGAQHKPLGRPTWRRQGPRPLSQPFVEGDAADLADLDKRASLPAGPASMSPEEFPSEPRKEAVGGLPASGEAPGVPGASSEANGPCPAPSPPPAPEPRKEEAVGEARGGGVVKVVWEGLRASEDCTPGPTGPELEAKVEEMVLEAIGVRQVAGSPELPSWVKEDRDVEEVVWEGVGGTDSERPGEGGRGEDAAQPRLPEQLQGESSRGGEGVDGSSPEGSGQRGSGVEGSFIWVERVTLSEEWEELLMEGAGPVVRGGEAAGGEETWEAERKRAEEYEGKGGEEKWGTERGGAEEPPGVETQGGEEQPGPETGGVEASVKTQENGGEDQPERRAEELLGGERGGEKPEAEKKVEEPLGIERREGAESLRAERENGEEKRGSKKQEAEDEEKRGEGQPGAEKGADEPLEAERMGSEEPLEAKKAGEELLEAEEAGEEPLEAEKAEGAPLEVEKAEGAPLEVEKAEGAPLEAEKAEEESLEAEGAPLEVEKAEGAPLEVEKAEGAPLEVEKAGEEPLEVEKKEVKEELSPEEQRELGEKKEPQKEEVSEPGAPLGAQEEPSPEKEELQPQEKQDHSLEEAVKPPSPPEGQGPSADATPLLAEISASEQPTASEQPSECQPLLPGEGPSAKPSAHPVPTYAPARQPEPPAPTEGEEASGPKQKTCQCCAVM
ncbi:PREDICTED: paralemmin-3 [Elephantulus edwardii]|uniref:paralemmin-3 n=1 Tax=Elephantulus edwardii TaxID=28737 RepID=UPI0003F077F9|nr:PREDICTED: paralemmin-3 [Elephantulus edwardii]